MTMIWHRGAGRVASRVRNAVAALLAVTLSACLLAPGTFTAGLDLRRDGRFTFAYTGEIRILALGKQADRARKDSTFGPSPCYDGAMAQRTCTAAEVAEQRKAWEESRKTSAERRAREAEQMKALLGGIDPSAPRAAEEFAARLRKQAGWKSVIHKGDGLFLVDYAISGRLDHDFVFPTIERFPMATPFVQLTRRADGTVRMDAPGFAASEGNNPWMAMMQAAAAQEDGKAAPPPTFDGTFTLLSDGAILANNTDDGPQTDPSGQRLVWQVSPRAPAAPTALIRLTP